MRRDWRAGVRGVGGGRPEAGPSRGGLDLRLAPPRGALLASTAPQASPSFSWHSASVLAVQAHRSLRYALSF